MIGTASYDAAEMVKGFDETLAEQMNKIEWSSSGHGFDRIPKGGRESPSQGLRIHRAESRGQKGQRRHVQFHKWSYRAPDDQVLIRAFVGGGHHEELVHELDDAGMTKMVLEELDTILGLKANAAFSKVYRWFKGMPKYTVGHLDRMALIDRSLSAHPGLHLIGCSYKGIGIGDCIHEAQIAAEKILKS